MSRALPKRSYECFVPWTSGDEQITAAAVTLRTPLTGWATLALWVGVRRRLLMVRSTPAALLACAHTAWQAAMRDATALAAELSSLGVTAVPAGDCVRAWIGGVGCGYVLIVPASKGGEPVWSWQHRATTRFHPRDDICGAATAVAAVLHADPP